MRELKKGGYKFGLVNKSKIICYNDSELAHFATECEKPKQPRKGERDYEELKSKYDALMRKQQMKAYVAEGKCWDDSDEDDDEEYGKYALMAYSDEGASSSIQVSILTTVNMTTSHVRSQIIIEGGGGVEYDVGSF